ncbi:CDF family Co(II)/Ni(II) efflux transporter DmeF [Campylobacter sp. MIT 19-121]|uniref:CDF family Co(II)/Ni(II) efflux transporter DmeF n=1 Tax=Campylobacter sp. MIT 19-121 TaxID=2703906 RepID=UPI0013897A49|nr:CDF family Co(II)/Ni(II) efflux transporter DmeF [Campylobacter sp. MIT 19-121]NDJ27298.1 CDF family Co(II)/Ni(II) efflux transporter DmeF [Campylobacter sp. MIT 19-121]
MNTSFSQGKTCFYSPSSSNKKAQKRIFYAFVFTLITMVVEIIAGSFFNSIALLADGWHMSSHAVALGLALLGYFFAKRYATDRRFNFGTYKVEILTAYTSALFLLAVAFFMVYESIHRFLNPEDIAYTEAIIVAFLGLFVNAVCVWLLKDDGGVCGHNHNHDTHDHSEHENCTHSHTEQKVQIKGKDHSKDLNLKAAYVHILADALTSILAIIALLGGLFLGWWWLDATMGLVGATLVFIWSIGLIKDSGKILLDITMDEPVLSEVLALSKEFGEIEDLHLLKIDKDHYACILSLKSQQNLAQIKSKLQTCKALAHISVEISS